MIVEKKNQTNYYDLKSLYLYWYFCCCCLWFCAHRNTTFVVHFYYCVMRCDTITIAMAIDFCLPAPYIVWKPHWKLSWAIHISNQSYQRWQKFPFVIVNNAIAEAIALMPSMVLRKWNYKFFIQDILEFVSFHVRCCSNEISCNIFHWLNWNVFFFFDRESIISLPYKW